MDHQTEEPLDQRIRRLSWACRRGMRELDLLLTAFLERRYCGLPATDQRIFEDLLEYPDPILYDYFMGRQTPIDPLVARVIQQIRRALTDGGNPSAVL
ncbi:FAD assembly factor SdhE [Gammaproteobacteria bacterium]